MTDLQDYRGAAASNADRAAVAARRLQEQLVTRNRVFNDSADPASPRLPDDAIQCWVEQPLIAGDFPVIAVAMDPAFAAQTSWVEPPVEYAGHRVEQRPWRGAAA
jgi:hypothetical protein